MPSVAIFGSAVFGASVFGVTVNYDSQPGAVLTQPGNFEPGALPPPHIDATIAGPTTWLTIKASAPSLGAGASIALPAATFRVAVGPEGAQATAQVTEPAVQVALRAASPTVASIAMITIAGRLPFNSEPGNVLTRPGVLEPGALEVAQIPGRHTGLLRVFDNHVGLIRLFDSHAAAIRPA